MRKANFSLLEYFMPNLQFKNILIILLSVLLMACGGGGGEAKGIPGIKANAIEDPVGNAGGVPKKGRRPVRENRGDGHDKILSSIHG